MKGFMRAAGGLAAAVGLAAVGAACSPLTPPATVDRGVLTVTGTANGEAIALRLAAGSANTLQVDFGDDGTADAAFDRGTFNRIVVQAGDGNDRIRIDQVNGAFADEETTLDGGAGNDVVVGGDGDESLSGGAGADNIDGNKGADRADLGAEDDTFVWDPGDGSDVIEGRAGQDSLVFNGAPVDEAMFMERDGQRAVFTRNVGNVRMDMDGVEVTNLTMLSGFDNFSISDDMTGTAMRQVNVDMSASGGGGDRFSDSVNVKGTPNADHITATAQGGVITVAGIPVTTTIKGSEIVPQVAIDMLQIGGAEDPDDTVVVDPAVEALISVLVNPHV